MSKSMWACATVCLGLGGAAVNAQSPPDAHAGTEPLPSATASHVSQPGAIAVVELVSMAAKSTGKKFLLDPRIQSEVSLGSRNPSALSYADLVMVLHLNGLAAVEGGGYVQIIPDAAVRTMALPLLSETASRPDAEYVTDTIRLKNSPAMRLVPILRPVIPQNGHLAADICSNTLIIVDTFANVRRIEAIVQRLDVGEAYKLPSCDVREMNSPRDAPVRP